MVNLPVSMIPEWYFEIPFITIEYHSIPLTSAMVHMPVTMIPEWYLEIPFITIEYQLVNITEVLNVHLPVYTMKPRMVFGNTINYY